MCNKEIYILVKLERRRQNILKVALLASQQLMLIMSIRYLNDKFMTIRQENQPSFIELRLGENSLMTNICSLNLSITQDKPRLTKWRQKRMQAVFARMNWFGSFGTMIQVASDTCPHFQNEIVGSPRKEIGLWHYFTILSVLAKIIPSKVLEKFFWECLETFV